MIELNGQTIEYKLKPHHNARCVRVRVLLGGDVCLTVPKHVSQKRAERFLQTKAEWVLKKREESRTKEVTDVTIVSHEHFLLHKESARFLVHQKAEQWGRVLGASYKTIRIKKTRTRWGSCSSDKNLNFNYKIIFLPEELQDYLIVHELCHLSEMNHSERFWSLVEEVVPDYRSHERALKALTRE